MNFLEIIFLFAFILPSYSACPDGQVMDTVSHDLECTNCSAGTYKVTTETETCVPCPSGKYAPNPGSSACTVCPAGRYASSTGAAACAICQAGTYSASGASSCSSCAAGTYSSAGSGSCYSCPAESYSGAKAAQCTQCPADRRHPPQPPLTTDHCVRCEPGTRNDKTSRTTINSCDVCSVGYQNVSNPANPCVECPRGTYSNEERTMCNPCPAGRHNNETKKDACLACDEGTFSTGGSHQCTQCARGTYNDEKEQSVCKECPEGTYSGQTGQVECTKCPAGTYSSFKSQTAVSACKPCTAGYHSEEGSKECSPCPANTHSSGTHCIPCLDGEYSMQAAASCKPCHPLCIKCHGDSQDDCDACYTDTPHISPLLNATCDCARGYFYDERATTPNTHCQPCFEFCAECKEKAHKCSACVTDDGVVMEGDKCVCSASRYFAYFNDATLKFECVTCHYLCKECTGPLATQCDACRDFPGLKLFPPSTCQCIEGYYYDENNERCDKCNALCENCTGGTSKECIACNPKISHAVEGEPGLCVTDCEQISGHYLDKGICKRNLCFQ